MAEVGNGVSDEKPTARGRGPSYPALAVDQAIGKAQQFWTHEKRGAAPVSAAAKHWGYTETSSSGKVAIAALLHYGLIEASGANENRMVRLTSRALDIILDSDTSPKRRAAVQDAVKTPKIYGEILTKWSPFELPSDQTLRFFLLREKGFNDGSVDSFIKDFRRSVEYAQFGVEDSVTPTLEMESPSESQPQHSVPAGIVPMAGSATGSSRAVGVLQVLPGTKQDTFTLDEGTVVLQWPSQMSAHSYDDFKDWIELQLRKIKRSVT